MVKIPGFCCNFTTINQNSFVMKLKLSIILLTSILFACKSIHKEKDLAEMNENKHDLTFFLQRLSSLDHLPELENSHTAMSSTWDTTGLNNDGYCFKNIHDTVNILLA